MGLLFAVVLGGLTAVLTYFFGYASWVLIVLSVLWLAAVVFCFIYGHHGFGGGGNTDVMIMIAGIGITIAVLIPKIGKEQSCKQPQAALAKLAQAENEYFAKYKRYTLETNFLNMEKTPQVDIIIYKADERSFSAAATHPGCLEKDGKGDKKVFIWDSGRGGLQPNSLR